MNSNMVYERIWKELREKMRKMNEGNKIVLPEFIQQMLEINGVTEVRGKTLLLLLSILSWFQGMCH